MTTIHQAVIPVITGPTASGKTGLASALAGLGYPVEVVSADSRQVYKRMNIGTAKPTPAERSAVQHHLVDILGPTETYSAGRFHEDAEEVISGILDRGALPMVVGGTGLYIRALTEGLSAIPHVPTKIREQLLHEHDERGLPALHEELTRVDPTAAQGIRAGDSQRILRALSVFRATGRKLSDWWSEPAQPVRYRFAWLGISWPRPVLRERIALRVQQMIEDGLRDEVNSLVSSGIGWETNAMHTVGYREWRTHFERTDSIADVIDHITIHTAQFAKRQMTWFRAVPGITWLPGDSPDLVSDSATWLDRVVSGDT